jgi:hypothetical protein
MHFSSIRARQCLSAAGPYVRVHRALDRLHVTSYTYDMYAAKDCIKRQGQQGACLAFTTQNMCVGWGFGRSSTATPWLDPPPHSRCWANPRDRVIWLMGWAYDGSCWWPASTQCLGYGGPNSMPEGPRAVSLCRRRSQPAARREL